MLDPNLLRSDLDSVIRGLASRGFEFDRATYQQLDAERRRVIQEAEVLKAERNRVSEEVAKLKRAKENADHLIAQQREVGDKLKTLETAEKAAEAAFRDFLSAIPNVPHDTVPVAKDERGNVEIKRWGSPAAIAQPKDHVDLGTQLGILDLDRAAKMSGARFSVLKGLGAKLERALINFMVDRQTAAGWNEVMTPYMVLPHSVYGVGQLPKFEEDLFKTSRGGVLGLFRTDDGVIFQLEGLRQRRIAVDVIAEHRNFGTFILDLPFALHSVPESLLQAIAAANLQLNTTADPKTNSAVTFLQNALVDFSEEMQRQTLYLISTAEVPVTNLYREEILAEDQLPLRHCAFTPCFRSEAGSYGKDTKGIIRQHQFHKVELVAFTTPDQAEAEHEHLTTCAEAILEALELPYRRMLLCTGDMGFCSQKTYDLEVWLPSQNTYREISSCSWFGDFQARRANIRFRPMIGSRDASVKTLSGKQLKGKATFTGKPEYLHTLNGSGLAVGRTWVAIVENGQQPDGSVKIPKALVPYLGTDTLR